MKSALIVVALVALLAAIGEEGTEASRAHGASVNTTKARATPRKPGPVPLVKQIYRNNCETASLSMLLASAGVTVDQRKLQRALVRSSPLDPIIAPDGTWTWGSPDEGFVGRVEGGGFAGGFGVYQGPIKQLATRFSVHLTDLSRVNIATIVSRLRLGRPVMSWIGLSEGPYRRWRTPAGQSISVNFGEHAVVLTGISNGMILVNDPLTGSRLRWTVYDYERKWALLGRRALGL